MATQPLVLVTGATGHLGNTLCRLLLQQGYQLRGLYHNPRNAVSLRGMNIDLRCGEITDVQFMRAAMKHVDVVIHLAAKIGIGADKDGEIQRINVRGPAVTATAALSEGIPRFLHVASVHMFDLYHGDRIDETSPLAGAHSFAYDASKSAGFQRIRAAIARGLNASVLCPVGLLGPQDWGPSLMGQFFIDLYNGKLPALMQGAFYWADVRDTAQTIIDANQAGGPGRNLSAGRPTRLDTRACPVGLSCGRSKPHAPDHALSRLRWLRCPS